MRPLSIKQAATAIDVDPNKVPQALGPALVKIAKCMILFPRETWAEIDVAMDTVQAEWQRDGTLEYRSETAVRMRSAPTLPSRRLPCQSP